MSNKKMEIDLKEQRLIKMLLENQLGVTDGCDPCFVVACEGLYNRILRVTKDSPFDITEASKRVFH